MLKGFKIALITVLVVAVYFLFFHKSQELRAMEKRFYALEIKSAKLARSYKNDNGMVLGKPTYARITAVYMPLNEVTLEDTYTEIVKSLEATGWPKGETNYYFDNLPSYKSEWPFKSFVLVADVIIVPESNSVNLYIDSHLP